MYMYLFPDRGFWPLALFACLFLAFSAQADPTPNTNANYSFNCIVNMPTNAGTAGAKSLGIGSTLTQTFIPRGDAFLTAFNRLDTNGARSVALSTVSLYLYGYVSSSVASTFTVGISRVETNGSRTPVYSQDFQQTVWGWTVRTWTFTNACVVNLDQTYELAVTLSQSSGGVSLLIPSADYADGACGAGGDIWFGLGGSSSLPVYTSMAASDVFTNTGSAYTNSYFFDTTNNNPYALGFSTNQNDTGYDYLRGKFLGVSGHAEKLKFTCPLSWAPVFSLVDSNLASLSVQTTSSASTVTNIATLNGLAEGETFLFAKSGSTVVGYWKLQSHPQRTVKLAYAYVRYPTEKTNYLYTNYPIVSSTISAVYAKANVAILWTNMGVVTYDWDANRDGSSYVADYSEVWSPWNAGVFTNMEKSFSMVYALRDYTNDLDYHSASGGGTSLGLGLPSLPPRGAMKRTNMQSNSNSVTIASTLAHEVGHNLGLSHVAVGTPSTDNLMDVGRLADNLFSFQWAIIHNTLGTLFDVPPAVALSAPTNGASFAVSSNVSLSAIILTNRNPIARVEFYVNGTNRLGFVTNAPYTCTWSNAAAGNYSLTALVYDNQWMVSTSTVASVAIVPPPTVTLTTPLNGSAYLAPASLLLSATVVTNGNVISKVQFYSGASLLGESVTAPFAFTTNNMGAGSYSFKARVIYNTSSSQDSAVAAVTVTNPPPVITLVAPTNNATYLAPATVNLAAVVVTNGNVVNKVQFYSGANLLGESVTAPFAFTTNNVSAGSYSFKARVIYNTSSSLDSTVAGATVAPAPRVPPVLSNVAISTGSGFTLGGTGPAGQTYVLQGATDLTPPVNWQPIATNQAGADGAFSFTDPQATNFVWRFYRTATP